MADFHGQHINLKSCVKLGKTFSEMHQIMLQAYGDQYLCNTQCYDWFKRFKSDWGSVDEDSHSRCPSPSTEDAHVHG